MTKTVYILIQISYAEVESPRHILGVYTSRASAETAGVEAFKKGGFYGWDIEEWDIAE